MCAVGYAIFMVIEKRQIAVICSPPDKNTTHSAPNHHRHLELVGARHSLARATRHTTPCLFSETQKTEWHWAWSLFHCEAAAVKSGLRTGKADTRRRRRPWPCRDTFFIFVFCSSFRIREMKNILALHSNLRWFSINLLELVVIASAESAYHRRIGNCNSVCSTVFVLRCLRLHARTHLMVMCLACKHRRTFRAVDEDELNKYKPNAHTIIYSIQLLSHIIPFLSRSPQFCPFFPLLYVLLSSQHYHSL